jgi:Spermine/spermidine synthase domain
MRRVTAGMVGFVGLTLEIAYTRIVSFKLFYYYTYFVIGLALLGFGASATVVALSDRLRTRDVLSTVRVLSPAVGLLGVLSYLLVAELPTDVNQIWVGSLGRAILELLIVVLLALTLTAVFFGLGLIISLLIVVDSADVRRLYFWDLAGAALGCLIAVPLQLTIGPPAMVLISLVLFAALGIVIAAQAGHGQKLAAVGLGVTCVAGMLVATRDVRTDETKTLRRSFDVEGGDWGAVFRVDAVQGFGKLKILHHDGLWGSSIWEYDGTPATTARFDTDARQIPWAALGRTPERILIIGAAGGNEIQAALTYGVGQVDAVELNPVTHHLLTDTFSEYSGNIANLPNVNYVQGDGRTFLARSDAEYDLIWFVAPDSYAASNAATSGAFVLSESYLYTREMIETAFDHLTGDGLMVAQFGDFDFEARPTRTARYLVTARDATADRIADFATNTALIVESAAEEISRVSTIVVSNAPFDAADVERIDGAIAKVPNARAVALPGGAGSDEGVTAEIIRSDQPTVDGIVDDYPFDISTITDDRPFFWHFTPYDDVVTDFSRGIEDSEIAIGERLLLMLLVVALVVAAILLSLPFLVSRRGDDAAPVVAVPGRWRLLVYFAGLGLGFMIVEISMIQRFALLLGYPTLSLSVSLFTLLIATAIGARFSDWIQRDVRTRLLATLGAMWLVGIVYLLISDPVTDAVLAWAEPLRIVLVFLLLFPVGVLLGMFLPTGIDRARAIAADAGADDGRLIAWCWAVNGFFSVIGSTSTTMLSMTFGFDRTVILGLGLYVIATVVMVTARSIGAPTPVSPTALVAA